MRDIDLSLHLVPIDVRKIILMLFYLHEPLWKNIPYPYEFCTGFCEASYSYKDDNDDIECDCKWYSNSIS